MNLRNYRFIDNLPDEILRHVYSFLSIEDRIVGLTKILEKQRKKEKIQNVYFSFISGGNIINNKNKYYFCHICEHHIGLIIYNYKYEKYEFDLDHKEKCEKYEKTRREITFYSRLIGNSNIFRIEDF